MGKTRLEAFSDGVIAIIITIAWRLFQAAIIHANGGDDSLVAQAVRGRDVKGIAPLVLYAAAIPLAFVHPALSGLLYVAVAVMWLVPDRRIESRISHTA